MHVFTRMIFQKNPQNSYREKKNLLKTCFWAASYWRGFLLLTVCFFPCFFANHMWIWKFALILNFLLSPYYFLSWFHKWMAVWQYLVSHFPSSRCWTTNFIFAACLFYPWAWTTHLRFNKKVVRYLQKVPRGCKEMEIWGSGTLKTPRKHPPVPVDTQAYSKKGHLAYLQLTR